jgi:hypothetical protein
MRKQCLFEPGKKIWPHKKMIKGENRQDKRSEFLSLFHFPFRTRQFLLTQQFPHDKVTFCERTLESRV